MSCKPRQQTERSFVSSASSCRIWLWYPQQLPMLGLLQAVPYVIPATESSDAV